MKKLLSVLLAICMIVSFIPVAASAENDNPIAIGQNTYATMAAAVAAITDNTATTIEVNDDITGSVNIPSNKTVTINLNGHTWTVGVDGVGASAQYATAGVRCELGSTVVINGGNGTIKATEDSNSKIKVTVQNHANLTLNNVTLDGTNQKMADYSNNNTATDMDIDKNSTFTLLSWCGVVNLNNVTIKNSTNAEKAYSIGCGWASDATTTKWTAGTQIALDNQCDVVNALVFRNGTDQYGNSLSTLKDAYGNTLQGTEWQLNSAYTGGYAYKYTKGVGFHQTTGATVAEVPAATTGDYPNPTGTTYSGTTVTVTGELPYISGRNDTPVGNYLWVGINLDTNKVADWTHVQVNSNDKIAKWNGISTDHMLEWHQKVTDVGSTKQLVVTYYNNDTVVYKDVITLDLTSATLESAPSTPSTPSSPSDDDTDVPTDETPVTNTVTADDGTQTTTTTWSDGKTSVSVKDPDGNVTTTVKSASGETIAEISLPAEPDEGKTFSDVNGWSKEAITKATGYGLFSGTSATTFEPQTGMTRAMVAQVLYNLSGKVDFGTDGDNYGDVKGAYAAAINWATASGVVSGNGDGTFLPDETVTREQLATMLYNFAKSIGAVEKSSTGVEKFPDGDKTSSWATEAMNWAIANGLINGSVNGGVTTLNPRDTATREQVASVMVKFVELLTK